VEVEFAVVFVADLPVVVLCGFIVPYITQCCFISYCFVFLLATVASPCKCMDGTSAPPVTCMKSCLRLPGFFFGGGGG
jgi:hypothetical protein